MFKKTQTLRSLRRGNSLVGMLVVIFPRQPMLQTLVIYGLLILSAIGPCACR